MSMYTTTTERPAPSIYNKTNKYGYRLNINHPQIKLYYDRFKEWRKIPSIPSDAERFEFEEYMVKYIQKHPEEFDE